MEVNDHLPHGDLIFPHVLGLLGDEVGDLSGHVAWGYRVGTSISHPLNRQRTHCGIIGQPFEQDTVYTARLPPKWMIPAFAALYAACNCGTLTMCPLMLAVATKLP